MLEGLKKSLFSSRSDNVICPKCGNKLILKFSNIQKYFHKEMDITDFFLNYYTDFCVEGKCNDCNFHFKPYCKIYRNVEFFIDSLRIILLTCFILLIIFKLKPLLFSADILWKIVFSFLISLIIISSILLIGIFIFLRYSIIRLPITERIINVYMNKKIKRENNSTELKDFIDTLKRVMKGEGK